MGVDYKNAAPGGRQSVRITSNASYKHGLIILDLAHMPGGICGTWPALLATPFYRHIYQTNTKTAGPSERTGRTTAK